MSRLSRTTLTVLAATILLVSAADAKKNKRAKGAKSNVVERVDELTYPALPEITTPHVERFTLDNGLQVLLVEDHELPLVQATTFIRTGSRFEPAEKAGLAGLTGSVLRTGGTVSRSSDQLNEFLESRAAVIETSVGTGNGAGFMSCLSEDFEEVLAAFADVLRNPAFEEDQIAVAKNQIEAGISRQNDTPNQILGREFNELIHGDDSPYARPVTYGSVRAITRDDILAWHREYFHPENTILGLIGDFDIAGARSAIESAFGDWPKGGREAKPVPAVVAAFEPGIYHIEKSDVTQSNIQMGHLGIQRNNPDYYAVEVMNQVLSGSFAARLFSNVRSKKGLAYSVRGGVRSEWDRLGLFSMNTSTKTETTVAAIDALLEEARNMTALPPTADEVARAKKALLNSFVFTAEDTSDTLRQQLQYAYYDYPSDWMSRYQKGIEAVTVEQVREAAARYIHPDQFAILVVGPSTGTDRPLSELGEVQSIDIAIPEPPAAEVTATDETLAQGRSLIDRAVEAIGGAERLDAVSAMRVEAANTVQTPQGEFQVQSSTLTIFPDRQRTELTLPFGKMVQVYAGEDSWMQSPQGAQPMPASMREDLAKGVRRSLVNLLRARGEDDFQAVAMGDGEVEGTAVDLVQVRFGGDSTTLGIARDTGHVVSLVYGGKNMAGVPGELRSIQRDFRDAGGLMLAHQTEVTFDGDPMLASTVDTIEVDPEVDDNAFVLPE